MTSSTLGFDETKKAMVFAPLLRGATGLKLDLLFYPHSRLSGLLYPNIFPAFTPEYFQSTAKGQELIIEENDFVTEWARKLIINGKVPTSIEIVHMNGKVRFRGAKEDISKFAEEFYRLRELNNGQQGK